MSMPTTDELSQSIFSRQKDKTGQIIKKIEGCLIPLWPSESPFLNCSLIVKVNFPILYLVLGCVNDYAARER